MNEQQQVDLNQLTPEQIQYQYNVLANAARSALLTGDQHDSLKQTIQLLGLVLGFATKEKPLAAIKSEYNAANN